jgi:hypothetical protein
MAGEIFVGSVAVGVVPDARGIDQKLRDQVVPAAGRIGDEAGTEMGRNISDKMTKAGDESGNKFERTFKARIKEALDTLPKAKLDGDSTEIDRKLEQIRLKMREVYDSKLIDGRKATDQIDKIMFDIAKLRLEAGKDINIDVKTNLDKSFLQLSKLRGVGTIAGGTKGGFLSNVTGIESAVQTAAGASSAGSGLFSNFLSLFGFGKGGGGGGIDQLAQALVEGGGRAGGGAGGAGGAGGTAASAGGQGGFAAGPLLAGGGAAAVGLALPFIGQMISGLLVSILGGGLTALGIGGAAMTGRLTKPFSGLTKAAGIDMRAIGAPMVTPLTNIIANVERVMKLMTPFFVLAEKTLAGPFQNFINAIVNAFAQPAVQKSIQAVAKAFGDILNAMSPMVAQGVKGLADAIVLMANAIAKNPKAFADFIQFLVDVGIWTIRVIAWLTSIAAWVENNWGKIWQKAGWWFNAFMVPIKLGITVLTGIFKVLGDVLQGHWSKAWHDILDTGRQIWGQITKEAGMIWTAITSTWGKQLATLRHNTAAHFDEIRHDFAQWGNDVSSFFIRLWGDIYGGTIGAIIRMAAHARQLFDGWKQNIINWGNNVKQWFQNLWNGIYNNTIGAIIRLASQAMAQFRNWKNNITGFFSNAKQWLFDAGSNIINGLLNGMKHIMWSVGSWINQYVYQPIKNAIIHFFHIGSPAQAMVPLGENIIMGLIKGMFNKGKDLGKFVLSVFGGWPKALASFIGRGMIDITKLPTAAMNAIQGLVSTAGGFLSGLIKRGGTALANLFGGGAVSGGVSQWTGTVQKALSMLGLPATLTHQVLYQMQTESGGNRNAINLTDINAKMGDPSRGLMQVIGSTFSAYHVPGTSGNIYDPLANIAAAINYALHRYGPTLMRGGMGIGSGHGYDLGGWLPPGVTLAYNNTGRNELVLTPAQQHEIFGSARKGEEVMAGGPTYHAHFDGLTGAAIEAHVRVAFNMMSMTQGALNRQGRRS